MALRRAAYLADKSALARMPIPAVAERLGPVIEQGLVATCSIIDLEILFSARSSDDHRSIRIDRSLGYERVETTQRDFDRAIEIQSALAERKQHRGASIPDLLIAAVAEGAGLTVLHYDSDFDLIAQVASVASEWVVPRGSIR